MLLAPFILALAAAPVIAYVHSTTAPEEFATAVTAIAPVPVAIAMIGVLLMSLGLARRDDLSPPDIGWHRLSAEDLAIGVVVGAAVTFGNLLAVFPRFEIVAPEFDPALLGVPLPLALVTFTIAVVAEDTLYRGYALRQLRRRYNTVAAIVITSAFYAMLTPPFHWQVTAWAFALGTVFCAVRFWRDSLWPVVIAHWIVVLGPRFLGAAGH